MIHTRRRGKKDWKNQRPRETAKAWLMESIAEDSWGLIEIRKPVLG